MSSKGRESAYFPLRTVTDLLSNSPTEQLPNLIHQLIAGVQASRSVICASGHSKGSNDGSTEAVTLHKFRTQLNSLLAGRSPEGRWAAIVLIKTTLELGSWEVLHDSGPWVRQLLDILRKPNAPEILSMCIVLLTRIFLITQPYATLVRTITTPAVTSFVKTCITFIDACESGLQYTHPCLNDVLESFSRLLPNHPGIFRSFPRLPGLLLPILAPTPSTSDASSNAVTSRGQSQSTDTVTLAQTLFVALHPSGPAKIPAVRWSEALADVIENLHVTADQAFRAVVEDWEATTGRARRAPSGDSLAEEVSGAGVGSSMATLPRWTGIQAGTERLVGLLGLLKQFILTPTSGPITLPMGVIWDILSRLLSLRVPSSSRIDVRLNSQISRAERDGLWLGLPCVHVAVLDAVGAMVTMLKHSIVPVAQVILKHTSWVFQTESTHTSFRTQTYHTLCLLLPYIASSLSKATVSGLDGIIQSCYSDLLPRPSPAASQAPLAVSDLVPIRGESKGTHPSAPNADTFTSIADLSLASTVPPALQSAASALLPLLISLLYPPNLKSALRTQLDRTAILTQHKEAMLAAVLNVPHRIGGGNKVVGSMMPHLTRAAKGALEVEGLLRPRMPVIRTDSDGGAVDDELVDRADETMDWQDIEEANEKTLDMYRQLYGPAAPKQAFAKKRCHDTADVAANESESMTESPTETAKKSKHTHDGPNNGDSSLQLTATSTTVLDARDTINVPVPHPTPLPLQRPSIDAPPIDSAAVAMTASATTATISTATIRKRAQPAPRADSPKNEDSSADNDDEDDDFEIPTIVMDPDTEDDDGHEAKEEGGPDAGEYTARG